MFDVDLIIDPSLQEYFECDSEEDQDSQQFRYGEDESLYTHQSQSTSCHEDIVINIPPCENRPSGLLYHTKRTVFKWIDSIERKDVYHFLACCVFVLIVIAFTAGIVIQKGM